MNININYKVYKYYSIYKKISIDSRTINNNCIFFALKGKNYNGNFFAEEALKKGAVIAVVDDVKVIKNNFQYILVDNVLITLQYCAKIHRLKHKCKVIGITGTNGKTTTKNILNNILSTKYNVISTDLNYNNEIGVPLTILKINNDTNFAIIEMGSRKINDINKLCSIALPDYGIITNIGKAHLYYFNSINNIKKAKKELYDFVMSNNGYLFVNNNYNYLNRITINYYKKILYGSNINNDIIGYWKTIKPKLLLEWYIKQYHNKNLIYINLIGLYNLDNILSSIAVAVFFKIPVNIINNVISEYISCDNRSQKIITKNNIVILDAYNSNPNSLFEAIKNFYLVESNNDNRLMILGNMYELGIHTDKYHKLIINIIIRTNIKTLLVGELFYKFKYVISNGNILFFSTKRHLIDFLLKKSIKNCKCLIKGSRLMKLEDIINYL